MVHKMRNQTLSVSKIDQSYILKNTDVASSVIASVFFELKLLSELYPEFHKWFSEKVIPGLYSGERIILLEHRNNELAGIAILKDTIDEQKICCLRVIPKYQNSGIGLILFKRSFQELDNEAPLVTVSSENAHKFEKIFNYFGFEFVEKYDNIYRPKKTEFSFNGILYLPPNKES